MRRDSLLQAAAAAPPPDAAWACLHERACAPYRAAGRWAWYWARGKLGRDPVFRGLLEHGSLPPRARVLDIGCGQGLLASLLQACADAARRGAWPTVWPTAPSATAYTGIDLRASDVARAQAALQSTPLQPRLVNADMRQAPFPACDLVVILDVLHYVDHGAQQGVLERVREALQHSRGRLLLRIGDPSNTRGYALSQWVDRVVTTARGHRVPLSSGRPLGAWVKALEGLDFTVRTLPMSGGTPFANVLLVADLKRADR